MGLWTYIWAWDSTGTYLFTLSVPSLWNSFFFDCSIQVKGTRRDNHTTTIFKGESGCMNTVISRKEHNHSRHQIYEICETDNGGEVCYLCLLLSSLLTYIHRSHYKFTVEPTNKYLKSLRLTRFYRKLEDWTSLSLMLLLLLSLPGTLSSWDQVPIQHLISKSNVWNAPLSLPRGFSLDSRGLGMSCV